MMREETNNPKGALFSPEGIMMLFIAGLFDVAGWISIILVAAFGIGVLLGQIVNAFGFTVIGMWIFFRSGSMSIKNPKSGKERGAAQGLVKKFLKKQWKKLLVEICPVLGDIYPGFILMVYSELKSS